MKRRLRKKGRSEAVFVQDAKKHQIPRTPPPTYGECPHCQTSFPSRYARKRHLCKGSGA